ncbi:nucleotidyltransferase family protein [Streptomyces sp. CHD11]|uniref:nucleotidyltransferase family protein n=1 Tax=Streptomyces sp. CHD11 TaxID=2741325 RepID=UPI001BFCD4AC|nr:nucleotidyltransferase family protein [Streptomyces sp. CHD11]MBT3149591.1 nucleotidyltransferase family protein [Streptomyces sp. CHD11]
MTENGEDTTPGAVRPASPDLRLASDAPGNPPPIAPAEVRPPVEGDVPELPRDRNQAILEAAKQVGAVLKRGGHLFALAGSVAVHAHGGSGNLQHDVDFCVRPEDAEAVATTLREAGLTVYTPPEDWLIKATCFGQDVDIIFELAHRPVSTEMLQRARELPVESVRMPVLAPTDLLAGLVAAFSEHHCDFGAVLPIARALREKVDWDRVRRENGDEPMPAAFFFLLERLNVI